MQPWSVAVVSGKLRDELSNIFCERYDRNDFDDPDYQYSPDPLPPDFRARARECGFTLYELKGIAKDDRAARRAHERENYLFFGAPIVIFFFLPSNVERGNFIDVGFFMQNVMLGFVGRGIGTCPQVSLTKFSRIIKDRLGVQEKILVAGMSVGYVDEAKIVNTFIPPRRPINEYVTWHE